MTQVIFNPKTMKKPFIRGDFNGTPRIWSVQIRADNLDSVLTFKTNQKAYIHDLAELIDQRLILHAEFAGVKLTGVRWIATAR